MPTLRAYRIELGCSKAELARRAGVSDRVIAMAEKGEPITMRSAVLVAQTLSRGLEKMIVAQHIEGLNIQ